MASTASRPVVASQKVLSLLDHLHNQSRAQESSFAMFLFYMGRYIRFLFSKQPQSSSFDDFVRDKFIALEPEKCDFLYLLARASGAMNVVEAGTSFGVSTIYLALAVGQNVASKSTEPVMPGKGGKVIATEKEESKAAKAREHWQQAGQEVEPWIKLLEGDLLVTLPKQLGETDAVDLLLLDIWTPLALPTLKLVKPKLRHGALVIADNTSSVKLLYKDLLDYIHDGTNGFRTMTTPFSGGLEVAVYLPELAQ
ncbi:hypothetical protein VTN00DRAFT_6301 [Thermoascus crustaceus]|uniref:uncharacterized protein n=1 Tax=Thermoascus crustaceus TaxID=5088 RepID=UPI003742AA18